MGIWQLINIVLFWVFFGVLSSHLAKRKGRHPKLWFLMGLLLGIFGVILVYILPKKEAVMKKAHVAPRLERSDAWIKHWYYVDPKTREQMGPMEFPDFAKDLKKKALNKESLVWGEGMEEWQQISKLPQEVVKDIELANK